MFKLLNNNKVALFDFCGTIINFQSADAYVKYTLENLNIKLNLSNITRKFLIKAHLMRVANKILCIEGDLNKKLILRQLKGFSKNSLELLAEKFYKEIIRPNYNSEIISEIKRCKSQGFKIFIVSGGYDIYIKHTAREFNFDGVICTELEFKNNIFTGKYKNFDCMGVNKIKYLKKFFELDNLKNFDSTAYSDSPSDMPLFNYCARGVAVYPDVPNWIRENKLEALAYHA